MPKNAQHRFSDRVANYLRYRPGYPEAVYDLIRSRAGLQPDDVVADLGSGTGLLSDLFLARGHRVLALEPNGPMRAAAEAAHRQQPAFVSLPAVAEHIPLCAGSVDFVVAGQAFHWFDPLASRREVLRILRAGRQVALIWNKRNAQASPFQAAYEQILHTYGTDFGQVDHQRRSMQQDIAAFFGGQPATQTLPNQQRLDYAGLQGRLLSSSYAPQPGQPGHEAMLASLAQVFAEHQQAGQVAFDYQTEMYFGGLG